MLTKRIIPCLDMTNGKVVKGIQFIKFRDAGDPVALAKKYDDQGADELVFLDITATIDNRDILLKIVEKTAKQVTIPFSVGGGIRSISDMGRILKAGADKVSINSGAFKNPSLISKCACIYGSQCVVLSLDAKKIADKKWSVFIDSGQIDTSILAIDWAKQAVALGAGEILLTSIDKDGTKKGFDCELTKLIANAVNVPIIASGGAGDLNDFYEIFIEGQADAALAASLFHFNKLKIQELKQYLINKKVPMRLN